MTSSIDSIMAGYESLRAGQEAPYTDRQRHLELSLAEHRTARRVAEQMQDAGLHGEGGLRPGRAGWSLAGWLDSGALARGGKGRFACEVEAGAPVRAGSRICRPALVFGPGAALAPAGAAGRRGDRRVIWSPVLA